MHTFVSTQHNVRHGRAAIVGQARQVKAIVVLTVGVEWRPEWGKEHQTDIELLLSHLKVWKKKDRNWLQNLYKGVYLRIQHTPCCVVELIGYISFRLEHVKKKYPCVGRLSWGTEWLIK